MSSSTKVGVLGTGRGEAAGLIADLLVFAF
jgi:hypothetical protein